MEDCRIGWIKERALTFLGENDVSIFNDMLLRERNAKDRLALFLESDLSLSAAENRTLVFFKSYVDAIIEEEVLVPEIVKKSLPSSSSSRKEDISSKDDNGEENGDDVKEKIKGKSKGKGKRSKSSKSAKSRKSSAEVDESYQTGASSPGETGSPPDMEVEGEKDMEDDDEDEGKKKKKKRKGKGEGKRKKSGRISPETLVETVPEPEPHPEPETGNGVQTEPEPEVVMVLKKVEKVIQKPLLHIFFGYIPEEDEIEFRKMKFVYFVRSCDVAVPQAESIEEAWKVMPQFVRIGTVESEYLSHLQRMFDIFLSPLVENMYQEPSKTEVKLKTETFNEVSYVYDGLVFSATCRRPSYYMDLELDQMKDKEIKCFSKIKISEPEPPKIQKYEYVDEIMLEIDKSFINSDEEEKETMTEETPEAMLPVIDLNENMSTSYDVKKENMHKLQLLDNLHQICDAMKWITERKKHPETSVLPCIETFHDDIPIDILQFSKDPEIVKQFETDIQTLQSCMKNILSSLLDKKLMGMEPLDECLYWQERFEILHGIVEELKLIQVNVNNVIIVLETAKSNLIENHISFTRNFMKHYNEAHDNHTYLCTIKRHFEIITEFPNFEKVQKAIEFTMDKLYYVWNLSGYYSNDETMVPLMEKIAFVVVKNVKKYLNLDTLFNLPVENMQHVLGGCVDVLETWKKNYYYLRQIIEKREKGQRWEFDKNKLFRESEWMKTLSMDLLMVANVLKDFKNIFGHELKSILKDPTQVDSVMFRAYALLDPFKQAEFDIYEWNHQLNWEATMDVFKTEVKNLELQVDFFISSSFELLRDTEQSIEILLKLIHIQTRPAIHEQLRKRFDYILDCYKKELFEVEMENMKLQAYPPLYRNHPPYSGSISWSNNIYMAIRKPILTFQSFPKFAEKDLRQNVYLDYLQVAEAFKKYVDHRYTLWLQKAVPIVKKGLSKSVLTCVRCQEVKPSEDPKQSGSAKVIKKKTLKTWEKAAVHRLLKTSSSVYKMKKKEITQPSLNGSSKSAVPAWKRPPTPVNLSRHTRISKQPKSSLAGMSMRVALLATKFKRRRSQIRKASQSPAFDSSDGENGDRRDMDLDLDGYEVIGWGEPSPELYKFQTFFLSWIVGDQPGTNISWASVIGSKVLLEYNLRFAMNFSDDLIDTLEEANLMEESGYHLPQFLCDIAVQKDEIVLAREKIEKLVIFYNELLERLTKAELFFVKDHLREIERRLYRGLSRITWASQGIHHFISSCQEVLKTINNIIKQLHKISGDLQVRIHMLSMFNLFYARTPGKGYFRISIKGFFSQLLKYRNEEFPKIVATYKMITPALIKLETLVLHTCTGHSPLMTHYYAVWEIEAYNALLKLCIVNLKRFIGFLHSKTAYFRVDTKLCLPDVSLDPSPSDIHNIMIHSCRDFMERFKFFKRWLSTTCIESPLLLNKKSGEEHQFTFFEEIMKIPQVGELLIEIQERVKHVISKVSGTLVRWKRYRNLWIYDKVNIVEIFASKNPSLKAYDDIFFYYENIIEESKKIDLYIDVNCVRINCIPVTEAIVKHAEEWKQQYGLSLAAVAREEMKEFVSYLEDLKSALEKPTDDLPGFRSVLQTVADIRNNSLQTEFRFQNIRDSFHTLQIHNVLSSEEELKLAHELPEKWITLYKAALVRGLRLESVKPKYISMAQDEINNFVTHCHQFIEKFRNEGPPSVGEELERGLALMMVFTPMYNEVNKKRLDLVNAEMLFDLHVTDYELFLRTGEEIEGLKILYKLYTTQKTIRDMWGKSLWVNLNPDLLNQLIEYYLYEFTRLPQPIQELSTGLALKQNMKHFQSTIPLMIKLKNESLRERHWIELMQRTGHTFDITSDKFTLDNVFAMRLHDFQDFIEELIMRATKELVIEKGVEEIENTWSSIKFVLSPHNIPGQEEGYILGPMDEILQILESDSINLQKMAESMYVGPFLGVVLPLETNLALIHDVLDEWLLVQQKLLNLENFFSSSEVCGMIPEEAKQFFELGRKFSIIMKDTTARMFVRQCCQVPERLRELNLLKYHLDLCQKSLQLFIETKRNYFPRFYFLSDEELVSILGSKEPPAVQEHICKMFNNITGLTFNSLDEERNIRISAMVSSEGEIMTFLDQCSTDCEVEMWMSDAVTEMHKTFHFTTKEAIYMYSNTRSRLQWLQKFQGMVVIAASQVWWTAEVENVFIELKQGNKWAMSQYLDVLKKQIEEILFQIRSKLVPNELKKCSTMILLDIYCRDIVENFIKKSVCEAHEFQWEHQLRFYWIRDLDTLQIKICCDTFEFGYEYSGLCGRLVITPLTDRLFLTITQALSVHLGCAIIGPSGTGKTETIKDLAKSMGLLFINMNCSKCMVQKAMSRILSGLVQCGAWGCFDEFDRISVPVLSVISTQIRTIQHAFGTKDDNFMFETRVIPLDRKVGIFITMNPGYIERVELPKSLQALFRTVACVVPDSEMICYVTLYSEGFLKAKTLAKKISTLYKLAPDILSKHHHYDFGLRSLKCVLVKSCELKHTLVEEQEDTLIVRMLKYLNVPKLTYDDVTLFLDLVSDIFLDTHKNNLLYEYDSQFTEAVKKALASNNFIIVSSQIKKVKQLYETMKTHHSTFIIGPSGAGKSVIIEALTNTQSILDSMTRKFVLNPKMCSINELYGTMDPITCEWNDGLLTHIFRDINKPSKNSEINYLILDGDVDPLWIENMNSVMDSNKLLTLVNGERITLQPHCMLLFEVGDLLYATPSTVSRAGMVYVDHNKNNYSLIWEKWLLTRELEEQKIFHDLFLKYASKTIDFVLKIHHTNWIPTPQSTITQLCFLLDALLPMREGEEESKTDKLEHEPLTSKVESTEKPPRETASKSHSIENSCSDPEEEKLDESLTSSDRLEASFLMALYNSVGALLSPESRILFDEFLKTLSGLILMEDSCDERAKISHFPSQMSTLFDYCLDLEDNVWKAWEWLVPNFILDPKISLSEVLVPTAETVKTTWILNLVKQHFFRRCYGKFKVKCPVLFVGESASAKTVIITKFLHQLSRDKYSILKINLSSCSLSKDIKFSIGNAVQKRTKKIFGPSRGKHLLCFIDDLHVPEVDKYGTQQPLAFLRLLFEQGGFYGVEHDNSWNVIKDIGYLAAMNIPTTRQQGMDSRFISKCIIFKISNATGVTSNKIFTVILEEHLKLQHFTPDVLNIVANIVNATCQIYQHVVMTELRATPEKFHYIFSLRNISHVIAGLCMAQPKYFPKPADLIRLWYNEFKRIFMDRLAYSEDLCLLKNAIIELLEKDYPQWLDYIVREPLLYGDFRNFLKNPTCRQYEDLLDYDAVYAMVQEILDDYNKFHSKVDLVLFDDVLEHFTRLHHTLRINQGHVLLVGVHGSGKQTITQLAAYTAGHKTFMIPFTYDYNEVSFMEDMKSLYNQIGVNNTSTVFYFSVSQDKEEGFLKWIDCIVRIGIIPTLYTEEEKKQIIESLQIAAEEAGYSKEKEHVWSFFLHKCVTNLHMVLSMSPKTKYLQNACRRYRSLVNRTAVDWIMPWTEQALTSVANFYMVENPKIPTLMRNSIINHVIYVHKSTLHYSEQYFQVFHRRMFISPKQFLDYIQKYIQLIKQKHDHIDSQQKKLTSGLGRIEETQTQINELTEKLNVQKEVLEQKTKLCEKMLVKIKLATDDVTKKTDLVQKKKTEIEEKNNTVKTEQDEIKVILKEALPALESARSALSDLERSDITEIRSTPSPPEPLQIVCECVAILRGNKDANWKVAKGMMADSNFLKSLQEMNCDSITMNQIRAVRAHMKKTQKMDQVKIISKGGYSLLKFVEAVLGYCNIYREVKPKKERIQTLEREKDQIEHDLGILEEEVKKAKNELMKLAAKYNNALRERKALQDEAAHMLRHLNTANELVSVLSSENSRWVNDLEDLRNKKECLIGDCLLAAAFICYAPPFTFEFRQKMIYQDWMDDLLRNSLPLSHKFKIECFLSDELEMTRWSSEGLPADEFSVQNIILTLYSSHTPVCIDPHQQAIKWIIKKEENNKLKILTLNDIDFLDQLEECIKNGEPVIIDDISSDVDPILNSVLDKTIKVKNGQEIVNLGGKDVAFHPKFHMYFITKLSNPNFNPVMWCKTSVINCSVTEVGLENLLLNLVVQNEEPDLQIKQQTVIRETFLNKSLIKNMEEKLLDILCVSPDDEFNTSSLLDIIKETKSNIARTKTNLLKSSKLVKNINNKCSIYRYLAKRGSTIYFVVSNMSMIDFMYEHSLNSYLKIFVSSLSTTTRNVEVKVYLRNVTNTLISSVYYFACLGIREEHRLLFAFQLAVKLEMKRKHIAQEQLDFFVMGSDFKKNVDSEESPEEWITTEVWSCILTLTSCFPSFLTLSDDVKQNPDLWKQWAEYDCPESIEFPMDYNKKLKPFERLMLLRCFRIDRLHHAIAIYISKKMGENLISPPSMSFQAIQGLSSWDTPVLFILYGGLDPIVNLLKYIKHSGIQQPFCFLSLGQGLMENPSTVLNKAMEEGHWLLFQNCHLDIPFVRNIKKNMEKIGNPNPQFRLWMTSKDTSEFPISLLQCSLKVATESPKNLKMNLQNTFINITSQELSSCQHKAYKPFIYVLSFISAILKERQKYGKNGWNICYDFNEFEYYACLDTLKMYLNMALEMNYSNIPWNILKYHIGEVIYGGKIVDKYDQRVLKAYIDEYFGEFLFEEFDSFYFYKDRNVKYILPPVNEQNELIESIQELPWITPPKVIGLHPNAELGYNTNKIREIWNTLIMMQMCAGKLPEELSDKDTVNNVVKEILEKVPTMYDIPKLGRSTSDLFHPVAKIREQELSKFNALLVVMRTTLESLQSSLNGEEMMNSPLQSMYNNILNNMVPDLWRKEIPETCKFLGNWMHHFTLRVKQYTCWLEECNMNTIWLSGLHAPKSYLTALMQVSSRKDHCPLDKIALFITATKWQSTEEVTYDKNSIVRFLEGLYLEGAHWNLEEGCLQSAKYRVLIEELPLLKAQPVDKQTLKLVDFLHTPIYTTSRRRDISQQGLVFEAYLKTREHTAIWITQGVCILLNTD